MSEKRNNQGRLTVDVDLLSRDHQVRWTVAVRILPFNTPNFVVSPEDESACEPRMAFPLSDVDAATLSAMCDQFRAEIFKKAGKQDPRLEADDE